jgi:serine/threonine protein kinase
MSADAPLPGTRLGPYTLERLLGQGGFAWVFSGRRDDGKSFAVKVLKPRYAADPAFESRFRQEAAFAAELIHPGIIHIEDVGGESGLAWFTMDLYSDSVSQRLADDALMPEAEAVRIALGVTEALAFAHGRNVIHRDIKPDNVLLGADGRVILTDFGIARVVSGYVAATGFMMTIGTPAYISPEQAQGRAADGRSDLYSLGIMLYRMVVGEVPFRSRDWFELARMHVEERPEPPRARRPEISKRLERIILRLLAKHPNDRHPSAIALAEDLADMQGLTRPTADLPVPEGYLRDSKAVQSEATDDKKWWKVW